MTEPRDIVGRLPEGARDTLPAEARELRVIEGALREVFGLYGYAEVATPILEYADVLEGAIDQGLGDAFRLFDAAGRVMVLRPDITGPVSRLVATRMTDHPGPVRAYYVGRAFRPPSPGAPRPSELRQAGAELVGAAGPEADAELIVLVHRALTRAGLDDLTIAVGDIGLTEAILDALGVAQGERTELGRALTARDLVRWRELAEASDLPAERRRLVAEVPSLRGGREVLDRVCDLVPSTADVCSDAESVLAAVAAAGIGDDVLLDIGMARDWPYYSGLILEAHSPRVGEPLAVGGRYDRLADRFHRSRPAVGFGIDLDVLHRALTVSGPLTDPVTPGAVVVGGLGSEAATAEALRALGVPVAAIPSDHSDPQGLARADGWAFVVSVGDGGFHVERVDGDAAVDCDRLEEVVRWMA